MATVNVDLYLLSATGRLMASLTDGSPPTLPPINAGDTWNISLYLVHEVQFGYTHSFEIERVQGAVFGARIRAAGNNTTYATALASGEVPVSTAPVIERTQIGTASLPEIQRITLSPALLPNPPSSSTISRFKILASGAGSGGRGGGTSVEGPSDFIYPDWTAAQIFDDLDYWWHYYQSNDGPHSGYAMRATYGAAFRSVSVATTYASGVLSTITIQFGDTYGGANWWNTDIHPVTVDDAQAYYKIGWAISLPFTDPSFADYLTHGPSYFDITRDGAILASIQIAGAPSAPAFTGSNPIAGYVDRPYSSDFQATGFPAPTFALTAGQLPDGLALSSSGHISGTPTSPGTYDGIVTATNSGGTATKSFSMAIYTVGGGDVVPVGAPGVLTAYRNGDFDVLAQSDGPYFENRDDEWPGLVIWHIPFVIDFDHYAGSVPALGAPVNPWGLFWKDTPLKFIGDGIVEFERLFHNIPPDASRHVNVSKTIQEAQYTTQGQNILEMFINTRTADVSAACNYHYALDDPGPPLVVPIIQIIPYFRGSQQMTDFGTGFPRATRNGIANLFTDNTGASHLPGVWIGQVVGRLCCIKTLYG